MNKKRIAAVRFPMQRHQALLFVCLLAAIYTVRLLLYPQAAEAATMPGGDITKPGVRMVDIAKPAIVRIITTEQGTLTVHIPMAGNATVTFPQNGGQYPIQLSGSGTFISSHGDILTADHVIRPPQDQSQDRYVQMLAAPDIADYLNKTLHPATSWTQNAVLGALSAGNLLAESHYSQPTSQVYLSTDYLGMITAPDLQRMSGGTFASVDEVKKESPLEQRDIAIIHVNMENTPNLQLGDSARVAQQDELTVIGFPGNGDVSVKNIPATFLTSSVNRIYVSAIKKTDTGAPVIQVDGNVEHGDSGGPALNRNGEIVGVVSFSSADLQGGTSFLQASSSAKELLDALKLYTKPGKFQKVWTKAFNDYAATTPGHWGRASREFQQLSRAYPNFHALDPYITYSKARVNDERKAALTQSEMTNAPAGLPSLRSIMGLILFTLLVTIPLLLFWHRRKSAGKKPLSRNGGTLVPPSDQSPKGQMAETDPPAPAGAEQLTDAVQKEMGSIKVPAVEQTTPPVREVVMDVQHIMKTLPLGHERIKILKGISFQIMSGEFISIVGPSGSGKSTLLGIIAGLDNPDTGQVFIDGVDITRMTEGKLVAVRNSKIGMVFQAFNLISTLTAQENVELPLYVGKHEGSPSARAKELLALVGLAHRLDHRPEQLSGGEQQRVAIARALAADPALVIADEPTGNLDASNGENVLKLIAELRAQTGKTFIVATHDPVVAAHADRVIRLVDGKVAAIDVINGHSTRVDGDMAEGMLQV